MQVTPQLGRYLTSTDDRRGAGEAGFAIVISDSFWHLWFNGAPNVIGQKLTLSSVPFTVVGVMPKSFKGPDVTMRPQIFVPLSYEPLIDTPFNMLDGGFRSWWLTVGGRLKPGVTLTEANAVLLGSSESMMLDAQPAADWMAEAREGHAHFSALPGARGYSFVREVFRKPLLAVFTLCGIMLLLACANLTSLLTARTAVRECELAVRLSMGALLVVGYSNNLWWKALFSLCLAHLLAYLSHF